MRDVAGNRSLAAEADARQEHLHLLGRSVLCLDIAAENLDIYLFLHEIFCVETASGGITSTSSSFSSQMRSTSRFMFFV